MYKVFYFNPLRVCCYVFWDEYKQCVIIDPGAATASERQRLEDFVDKEGLEVKAILLTHGHFDHVLGLKQAADRWEVPVYMNPVDSGVFAAAEGICEALGLPYERYQGEMRDIARCADDLPEGLQFEIIPTPGHTQGSVCLYRPEESLLFSGDTLFAGSVGRSDHPGGNFEQLIDSIKRCIMTLPPDTGILPGHGYDTVLETEIATNPFLI